MSSPDPAKRRVSGPMQVITDRIETDPQHHLAGPFMPQTPLGSNTPDSLRSRSPASAKENGYAWGAHAGLWYDIKTMRWAVVPSSAFKLLLVPVVLYVNWEVLAPYVAPGLPNPFRSFLLLSHHIPTSPPDNPLYAKGYLDLIFVAYHIVFFSFVRQIITINISRPVAQYFGIKKVSKLDRFGEQGYALVYFGISGAWGFRIMSQLPTWWFRTENFWIGYPHWEMSGELKRYYLMQGAYWCQQLIVLLLGLEKPRKDYSELVAHHFVTLWLVGWSYLINLTLIGNAVYMSMDIPDSALAFSKLLNYIQWNRAKVAAFLSFLCIWTYFRHWYNLRMLWSVWFEFDLIPETSQQWDPPRGVWLVWWMKYQIFFALGVLQVLNLFWYFLILRIFVRTVTISVTEDERSDDEDDGEDESAEDSKED